MYRPERGHRVSSARNGSVTHQVPKKAAAGATVAFAKASSSGGPAIILYSNVKRFELGLLATVPIDKILSVKNARAWVTMVSYLKK